MCHSLFIRLRFIQSFAVCAAKPRDVDTHTSYQKLDRCDVALLRMYILNINCILPWP